MFHNLSILLIQRRFITILGNVILPLAEANFFEYIGMPKRFDVDENALKKR